MRNAELQSNGMYITNLVGDGVLDIPNEQTRQKYKIFFI